ncbi:MAG: hypothetical protein KHW49_02880 [Eubacterium sp.]|jgi:hypothetical protein|nr:hypothetical protein [Eubacterium sp.]
MASILKKKYLTGVTTTNQNQSDWSNQRSTQNSNGTSWNTSNVSKKTINGLNKAERSYNSPYSKLLSGAVNDIQNRKDFEYDLNEDALYKQYADQYKALGNQAMQDTMANAATLTGGYANSYATTAGQQAYNSYLQQLNDIVPQLYQQARSNYDNQTQNLYNKASLYQGLDSEAYQRWSNNRNYYMDKYNNEWNRNAVSHSKQTDTSSQSSRSGSSSSNMQSTYANTGAGSLVLPTVEERYNAAHSYNNAKSLIDAYGLGGRVNTYKQWKKQQEDKENKDRTYTDYQNYLSDALGEMIDNVYTKKARKKRSNK